MAQREIVEIEMVVAEDFVAQIIWTDEDGEAFAIKDPCRLEVRDSVGELVLQFDSTEVANATTKAVLAITGSQGLIQLSAPKAVTDDLIPGRYVFDLWATRDGDVAPFTDQEVQVTEGWLVVSPRTTIMEVAPV